MRANQSEPTLSQIVARLREIVAADPHWLDELPPEATALCGPQPISTAPGGRRVLVYMQGGWTIAMRDAEGHWRNKVGDLLHSVPKWWAPLPPTPSAERAGA